MQKLKLNKSVFIVLLAIFFAAMVPIYILGFGIYQLGHGMITTEISQSLQSRSNFFLTTLEKEIARIKVEQYEFLNDGGLFFFVNAWTIMDSYDRTEAMLALQKRIDQMYKTSSYIENVSVFVPSINRMFSAKHGIDPMTSDWEKILSLKPDNLDAGIVYYNNEMYICYAYPSVYSRPDSKPSYILITKISSDAIKSQLLSFNMYEGSGTTLSNTGQKYSTVVGDKLVVSKTTKDFVGYDANGEEYLIVDSHSNYLNMDLSTYVPCKIIYGNLYKYRSLFILFTVMTLSMLFAYLWLVNRFVTKPIRKLVKAFEKLEDGDLDVRIAHISRDEFGYLYSAFNEMVASLQNMIEVNYNQRMLTQQAELRQLQAQINPHFLYNSFFILYRMAKDEYYENMTDFLMNLSNFYRYITRDAQIEVPLLDEVIHADRYAKIQSLRFKKRITVEFDNLPLEYEKLKVPKLILQPLLENAFDHGLKDVEKNGKLTVSFAENSDSFTITVQDNGEGMTELAFSELLQRMNGQHTETTGVVNIHKRLQLHFGNDYGLRVSQIESGGMCWEIVIPVHAERSQYV